MKQSVFALFLLSAVAVSDSQASPETLALRLVNIAFFPSGVSCPPAPEGTRLLSWERSVALTPEGDAVETFAACHYLIPESVTADPYPQRTQVTIGGFDLAGGRVEFTALTEVLFIPGPTLAMFHMSGDVTGGTGDYEDVRGTIIGHGPLDRDSVLGFHLLFPFILSLER